MSHSDINFKPILVDTNGQCTAAHTILQLTDQAQSGGHRSTGHLPATSVTVIQAWWNY